ncbi:MAG: oxidoreductase [Acidobacteria bacterium]|nr:oxidoreductase [Acidobacteriota bacterium]
MRARHGLGDSVMSPLALALAAPALLALLAAILACAPTPDLASDLEPGADPESTGEQTAGARSPAFEAREQTSNTRSRLQAVSAVDTRVVWVSGLDGTHVRTLDGGRTWLARRGVGSSDSETLQFRDIHAFDANTAYLLSAGEDDLSRIYRTDDGGASWDLQFINREPEGFLDCFDFWDRDRGIAYGDSIRGDLFALTTRDGATWSRVSATTLPSAGEGEGGFAASGTCVETAPAGRARIATGTGGNARVLTTEDHGETWSFADTPTVRGAAAGLMSVVFGTERQGVALGGDLEQPEAFTANVAVSQDGGASWTLGGSLPFPGAAYGGAWGAGVFIAAGPGGIGSSIDSGRTWQHLSDLDTWAVDFGDGNIFWAVGPEGQITRFERVP